MSAVVAAKNVKVKFHANRRRTVRGEVGETYYALYFHHTLGESHIHVRFAHMRDHHSINVTENGVSTVMVREDFERHVRAFISSQSDADLARASHGSRRVR